jgi:hypothetical protein
MFQNKIADPRVNFFYCLFRLSTNNIYVVAEAKVQPQQFVAKRPTGSVEIGKYFGKEAEA